MKTVSVVEQPWDCLIILDACRYDYFERAWQKFLQGRLEKRVSIGSSTNEWRDKSFPGFYEDIVYISANPQICDKSAVYGYTAGEHFGMVCEVWKDRWDQEVGTVRPEALTQAAAEIIRTSRNKRFVVHYLQPHAPYLSLAKEARGYLSGDVNTVRKLVGADTSHATEGAGNRFLARLSRAFRGNRILPNHPEWLVRKLLGAPPMSPLEAAWRSVGRQRLRQAYADNLDAVLEQVAELLKHLSGTIIVTSDHGELLGERRRYGHPTGSHDRILKEVPWLIVEKGAHTASEEDPGLTAEPAGPPGKEPDDREERRQLSDKLRALGYFD